MFLVNRLLSSGLKFFFYLLYNHFAWTYDWVAAIVSMGHWQDWICGVLPHLRGKCVLELGHGPGHLQVAMHQRGFVVFGLDLSSTMGKLARSRLVHSNHPMRLVRGTAQQLPFPPNTFDQIVSTFPSEYVFQTQTIAEIYRVLTPGGLLIVLPVAWIRRGSRIERSLAWLYEVTHQTPPRKEDQWKMEVTAGFRQAGFDVQTETATVASSEIFLVLASKPKVM